MSTTAFALAQSWSPQTLLVEVDPAGGTLAARLALPAQPGLASWAAASRRDGRCVELDGHFQQLPGGVQLVAAPASGEQTRAALSVLAGRLPGLAHGERDVIADCGRFEAESLLWPLVGAADVVLLVARPDLPDLHALSAWLESHRGRIPRLAVVLAGAGSYGPAEISEALDVDVLAGLPWDPRGVGALTHGAAGRRKGAFFKAAEALVAEVAGRLPAGVGPVGTDIFDAEPLGPPRPSVPPPVIAGPPRPSVPTSKARSLAGQVSA